MVAWINCNADQLRNGQCTFDVNETLNIRPWQEDTNVNDFVQDIVLSSTFFIWTVVAVGLIYSWWLIVIAKDSWAAAKWKNGVKRSFIGLILVMFSYTIIRLVQYIARG